MGYYELAGGRSEHKMYPVFGQYEGSSGHMRQTGGEFEVLPGSSYMFIGGQGTGMVHIAGGTFKSAVLAFAPKSTGAADRTDGCGRISVANGARPCFEAGVMLADRIDSLGMVELSGGGVMEAKSVTKREKTSQGSVSTGNAKAYVNFNGGGVCAISNNVEFLGTGDSAVDRATVYAAGAILEASEGISANVSVPLQAPSGGGVASLALPAEPFDAYHCAPLVFIYGDGCGRDPVRLGGDGEGGGRAGAWRGRRLSGGPDGGCRLRGPHAALRADQLPGRIAGGSAGREGPRSGLGGEAARHLVDGILPARSRVQREVIAVARDGGLEV
jgi:hypothetical protein